jgi:hypothetical protein
MDSTIRIMTNSDFLMVRWLAVKPASGALQTDCYDGLEAIWIGAT